MRSGQQHPGGEGGHEEGDGGVEDLPGSGAGEEGGEFAGEEAQGEEPGEAGGYRAYAVEPAAVGASLVGEGAQEDDGVQVDVGVEVREAQAGQYDAAEGGGGVVGRCDRTGLEGSFRGEERIGVEECRSAELGDVERELAAVRSAPRPRMPPEIRSASESAQVRTTGRTCSRRRPWRRTNTFWAPIATIRDSAVAKPARRGMSSTVGTPRPSNQLKIVMHH